MIRTTGLLLVFVLSFSTIRVLVCETTCDRPLPVSTAVQAHCSRHVTEAAFTLTTGAIDCRALHEAEPATKTLVRDAMMVGAVAPSPLQLTVPALATTARTGARLAARLHSPPIQLRI